MTKILYRQDNGVVAIITPILTEINPNTGEYWTIDEIAAKDVPTGKKYKKVEDSDISEDRSFRDAWTVDESDLTDGVGA
mgnify:FL=1|tara:strand:+ start:168 stop:404 length:237 start_codon:yes stop_codon:yes gene_type:complete